MSELSVVKTMRLREIAAPTSCRSINLTESAGADLPQPGRDLRARAARRSASSPGARSRAHPDDLRSSSAPRPPAAPTCPGMSDYAVFVKEQAPGVPRRAAAGEDGDRRGRRRGVARRRRDAQPRLAACRDYLADDELDAIRIGREIVAHLNWRKLGLRRRARRSSRRSYDPDELLGIASADVRRPFDVREVIARIVDGSRFEEFKPLYGTTLVSGLGAHPRLPGRHPRQQRHPLLRVVAEGRAVHPALQPDRHAARSSCRTSPASWSARSTSRAASSRTARS